MRRSTQGSDRLPDPFAGPADLAEFSHHPFERCEGLQMTRAVVHAPNSFGRRDCMRWWVLQIVRLCPMIGDHEG